MANQNDTFDIRDLDLSNVEGFEGFGEETNDDAPIEEPVDDVAIEEPETDEPIEDTVEETEDDDDEPISWSYIESIVPEPLHEDLKPLVEDWQRRYQRVIEETEPLRKFTSQGLTEQDIEAAIQMQQALVKDPRKFYDGLGETYGWAQDAGNVAELRKQIEQTQQLISQRQTTQQRQPANEFENYFGFEETETQQPAATSQQELALQQQLAETQQRLQQLEESQKQSEEQRIQMEQMEAGRRQLESELSALEKKYGTFDRAEVVKRAVANAHAGNNPSVAHAYHELRDYEENLRRKYASKRPPKVVGSGSGMTAPAPPDLSSEDAKREAALALAIRLGSEN